MEVVSGDTEIVKGRIFNIDSIQTIEDIKEILKALDFKAQLPITRIPASMHHLFHKELVDIVVRKSI